MSDKREHRRTLRLKEEPEEGTYKEKLRDLNTEKIKKANKVTKSIMESLNSYQFLLTCYYDGNK